MKVGCWPATATKFEFAEASALGVALPLLTGASEVVG
jgi:hypothetical protein